MEQQVVEVLSHGAGGAAAIGRSWRTWVPVAAAAASVLVVLVAVLAMTRPSPEAVAPSGSPTLASESPAPSWTRIEYRGISVDLPPGWVRLDSSGCDFGAMGSRFGPPGVNPCRPEQMLGFFGSALYDPAYGPGLHGASDTGVWDGYTYAGDSVVWISADDRQTAQRVLDSVGGSR